MARKRNTQESELEKGIRGCLLALGQEALNDPDRKVRPGGFKYANLNYASPVFGGVSMFAYLTKSTEGPKMTAEQFRETVRRVAERLGLKVGKAVDGGVYVVGFPTVAPTAEKAGKAEKLPKWQTFLK